MSHKDKVEDVSDIRKLHIKFMSLKDNVLYCVDLLLNPTLDADIVKGILLLKNGRASKTTDLGELIDGNWPKNENADAMEHMVHTIKAAAGT
jgi:hypothetical protein